MNRMRRLVPMRSRVLLSLLAFGSLTVGLPVRRAHAAAHLSDGRVTARLERVSIEEAIHELSALWGAGLEWRIQPGGERISTEFTSLSLEEALTRVLGRGSFFVVYGRGDRVPRRIVILGLPGGGPEPHSTIAAGDREPIPQAGELLTAIDGVLANDDPQVRLIMIDTVAALAPDDPRRVTVLDHLLADPDATVRAAALRLHLPTVSGRMETERPGAVTHADESSEGASAQPQPRWGLSRRPGSR